MKVISIHLLVGAWVFGTALAGPYSAGLNDPLNSFDASVPGFVGPDGDGISPEDSLSNFTNPIFFGWAEGIVDYSPSPGVGTGWRDPTAALGPVTGDNWDIVSLGDLGSASITNGVSPGRITVDFVTPVRNLSGADFVIFENGFVSAGGAGIAGQLTAELAYVEVSSNGSDYLRFPSRSLTLAAVGGLGTIDPSNAFNLAGKHGNGYGKSWGTPFDLSQLASDPLVIGGQVNLEAIRYVRIVDIPGNGAFSDSQNSPIFDAWLTSDSGGFDLEAVGAISQNATFSGWAEKNLLPISSENDDSDGDGLIDLLEYAFARIPTIAENSPPTTELEVVSGHLVITFDRDERAMDLVYEIQASDDLQTWTTLAKSQAGGPVSGVNGFAPNIVDVSASSIASIGVIRKVSLTDVVNLANKTKRFLRVKVSKL